jgi:1-acyl-sn-glycerol-3-phosphate acyltransferase
MGLLKRIRRIDPAASGPVRIAWFQFARTLLWLGCSAFWRIRAFGLTNIPPTGPVLLLANHQSFLDLVVIGGPIVTRNFHPMARKTLFKGTFGKLIASVNATPIDQEKSDLAGLRRVIELLKGGNIVLVFPEGSRTPDGFVKEFQEGLMLLIRRAQPMVVPVAVEGPFDVWRIKQKLPHLTGRMASKFGKPIPAAELLAMPPGAAMSHISQIIDTMRLELRQALRTQTDGRFPPPGPTDGPSFS